MPKLIQVTETSPLLHNTNCIYCHVDLELGDSAVVCDTCGSPHHADCWLANGDGCATFGCGTAITSTQNQTLSREQAQPGSQTSGVNIRVRPVVWPEQPFSATIREKLREIAPNAITIIVFIPTVAMSLVVGVYVANILLEVAPFLVIAAIIGIPALGILIALRIRRFILR